MSVITAAIVAGAATAASAGLAASQGSPDYGGQAAAAERKRQQAITQGTADINKAFSGFTPDFYNQRAKAYEAFALPQLGEQFRNTRNQEIFSLANRGILGGSAANQQMSQLNRLMFQNKQGIADTGLAQAQALQQQVEGRKSSLLDMLNQSADPANARQSAIASAGYYAQPSVFSPIANMFGDVANQYYLSQLVNSNRPTSYVQSSPSLFNNAGAIPAPYYSSK